ncbi:spore germination protein [Paenibacillus curdlanolyticus YK9]|uniref:Spore germination protein n=1 Tax=Paenibacillus curdlanolyticus YK9 TaxID=717606 RepID=E0ID04_9BACL|nr:GerAB/ArcD/ProY family transporter [Paenibacillus curdlanolyticus]EFM09459.1 spore germination protein [Paenibacillus curdlanolyticus YK9]
MKNLQTISVVQTAFLFFIYITGSAIIVIPGPLVGMAMNAAWLSLLISLAFGLALLAMMLYLINRYPGVSFIDICRKTIGKWPTFAVAGLMLTMAFHMAAGILIDVAGFMNSMMLPETPAYVFTGMMFIVVALLLRAGIETIARMFVIMTVIVILFWAVVIVLLIPDYHLDFLAPIFPEGIKPMLLGSYFTFGFPYGEVVLFMTVLPYARTGAPKKLKTMLVGMMIINVVILILSTICTIMTLGPLAAEKRYPLFVLAQIIEIGDIIERMEAIVGMSMIAGSLMKATITMFAILTIVTDLFKINNRRLMVNPLCVMTQLMALTLPATMLEWEELVVVVHPLWVGVVYVLPLVFITTAAFLRKSVNS